ncbi:MAG TPA: helix-turn-helix transcriptional regulator [Bacteroidales bacterium]|nr:helix-turn-helix transcriptional regulator [Bacteroidales bacterium]
MKNQIKVERARKNITQGDLADALHVSRQTINALENAKFVPSTALALKMAHYFGCKVEELFELEEGD